MLVINYSGNKPQQDRFKFAVNGDNNSQTIKFVLKKQQGDIDLSSPSFTIYFLCQSQDKCFVDKAEITTVSEEGNDIILEYKLLGKHTQFKAIDVGISFENENQEIVYKTASATISIQKGIMADEEIENLYPTIIKQIQDDILALQQLKQDLLVSGQNIKTINNTSILGSGNITISTGTKLYQHDVTISSTNGNFYLKIISTYGDRYNIFKTFNLDNADCVSVKRISNIEYDLIIPTALIFKSNTAFGNKVFTLIGFGIKNEHLFSVSIDTNPSTILETITEL